MLLHILSEKFVPSMNERLCCYLHYDDLYGYVSTTNVWGMLGYEQLV